MPNVRQSHFCQNPSSLIYFLQRSEKEEDHTMELELTEKQLSKFTKNDIIQLLLQSMENEKQLRKEVSELTRELKSTNQQMQLIIEKWNLAQANRFGRSTEKKLLADEAYDQLELAVVYAECFNEAEATTAGQPPFEPDMDTVEVGAHKRKKQKGKRENDLKDIPHEEIPCELTETELLEKLGPGYRRLKDEVYKRLEFVPASFTVKEYHVAVYVSRDGKTFVKGKRPKKDLFRSSIATPSLLAAILNYKYVNAMPIHRLAQDFRRNDLELAPQVMCSWVIKGCEVYLSLIYDELKKHLFKQPIIQIDETTLKVTNDGRSAGTPSYMWTYLTGEFDASGQKIVIYDYQKTRATDHPRKFLSDFHGTIVSDGYISYKILSEEKGITAAGCYAHARRRFANAIKAAKKDLTDEQLRNTVAGQALERLGVIYKLEGGWKEQPSEYRVKMRNSVLKPLVEEYFSWAKEQIAKKTVLPESETGEGLAYSVNQEIYLKAFLEDGDIPIDNSAAERAIRPFCVGRKNWNIIDTINGAQASAIAYSIAETAKANNLKPYEYFRYLLTELAERVDTKMDAQFTLEDLMPWSPTLPEECRRRI